MNAYLNVLGIGADFFSIIITFVILLGVLFGKKNAMNEYFPFLLLLQALTLLADMAVEVFDGDMTELMLLKSACMLQLIFIVCQIAVLHLYVARELNGPGRKKTSAYIFCFIAVAAMAVLCIMSLKYEWLFKVDSSGHMTYGTGIIIAACAGYLITLWDSIKLGAGLHKKKIDKTTACGIYIFFMIPAFTFPFTAYLGTMSIFLAALTISYLTMYISIYVRMEQLHINQKAVEEKMQTELIMSQIQPHFIFNTLTTISYLCRSNPPLAAEAVAKFSKYLRRNLNVVSEQGVVQLKDELELIRIYLWLEQLRFDKTLNVEYSIDCDDFYIPPLSIQPIVENAVKHGITKKVGGGTVSIKVREYEKFYRITVKDDGVGFDKQVISESSEPHIGISDVRKRLSAYNGSTLKVSSQLGEGTTVVYDIMKQK